MNYWTLAGNKIEDMAVVPLFKGLSVHNTIRKRHEARMARGKKKNRLLLLYFRSFTISISRQAYTKAMGILVRRKERLLIRPLKWH